MRSKWEPKQWIEVRSAAGNMVLKENYPATGVPTRNTKNGRELRDSDAWRQVSSPAQRLLLLAQEGDADAYEELVEEIAANVQRVALEQHWSMDTSGVRARGVAAALLSRHFGAAQSDNIMASVIGISGRAYRKSWRDRMDSLHARVLKTLI